MVLLNVGDSSNIPIKQFLLDSEDEMASLPDCPPGSTILILTDSGLITKMKNSKGEWVNI